MLLSSEPYPFREKHLAGIRRALPAGSRCRVALMDGEMVSWYGSRAIRGLPYLLQLRLSLDLSGSRPERNMNAGPTP